ncbi:MULTISPECIES: hypothetical protein [unclassified Mesorhizobium]|uniref:hypothetical protein n=1 Tax=unclassified Mesorhizobium TaxID=325217 RepID=UPI0003CF32FE|nr:MULTISPECIES: hypothetical protein [unclassified Mesorhizobium]ESY12746.1 hypothetical protein X751_29505 [Mesorhizobium sp. LNJC395A00]WJI74745.1 hypothetical protein NLY37_28040 [Mesorhizobium sp. C395A]
MPEALPFRFIRRVRSATRFSRSLVWRLAFSSLIPSTAAIVPRHLSSKPTEKNTHQNGGVEPISLGAAAVT